MNITHTVNKRHIIYLYVHLNGHRLAYCDGLFFCTPDKVSQCNQWLCVSSHMLLNLLLFTSFLYRIDCVLCKVYWCWLCSQKQLVMILHTCFAKHQNCCLSDTKAAMTSSDPHIKYKQLSDQRLLTNF